MKEKEKNEIIRKYMNRYNEIAEETNAPQKIKELAKDLHLQELESWIEQAEQQAEKMREPKQPKTKWKAILLQFYNTVKDQHDPDIYDYWKEEFETYGGNKERIAQIIEEIFRELGIAENYKGEDVPLKEQVSKIGERAEEEYEETLLGIERVLLRYDLNIEEYQNQEYEEAEKALAPETMLKTTLERAKEYLENAPKELPQTEQTQYIQKTINITNSPDILEELTEYYEQRLFKLSNISERIPLWIASSFAPPIKTNYGNTNSSINILLIGETGTGKSTVKKLIKRTAPKYIDADVFTSASFTGTAHKVGNEWEIQAGYIPKAHNGILAIPEIDKILKDPKLEGAIRESIEKMTLKITKGGTTKEFPTKYGLLLDSNFAGNDYFEDGSTIYTQMGTTRRLLSRIDDPIPFGYTKIADLTGLVKFEKELLVWNWDNPEDKETTQIKQIYEKLRNYVTQEINVIGVMVTEKQAEKITQKLEELITTHNDIEAIRGRHFLTALKYIYASTTLHAYNRDTQEIPTKDKTITRQTILKAEKKDLETALEILESVVNSQVTILREGRKREVFKDYEEIVEEILTRHGMTAPRNLVVKALKQHKVSRATAYRILKRMINNGKLVSEEPEQTNGKKGGQPTIITLADSVSMRRNETE